MSTKDKTLAKSLHTITALVRVAILIRDTGDGKESEKALVDMAAAALGYSRASDPYGLKARAAEILAGE